jgi:hypothetical protein
LSLCFYNYAKPNKKENAIMDQYPSNAPTMGPRPGPAGWLPVWIKAVTKPNEMTFAEITAGPEATSKTAFLWIFIAGTLSALVSGILGVIISALGFQRQINIPGFEQFQNLSGGGETTGVSLVTTICSAPLAGLFTVLFFAIGVAIVQWIAKLFGGSGSFDKLAYAMAAISVPFSVVSMILTPFGAIPILGICTGLLSFGLGIYALVLEIMAVKGVNGFGWGPAIGSVLIPGLVLVFLCACIVGASLAFLGPVIGDVFRQINQSLAP